MERTCGCRASIMLIITFLEGQNVKWFTDNTSVVSIVRKGSINRNLQEIALKISEICLENQYSIREGMDSQRFE